MKKDTLNRIRRMGGVPQDFSAVKKKPVQIVEDVIPGMSQVLRGGKNKFYLVTDTKPGDELGDVIVEVDMPALANIIVGASHHDAAFSKWELFPHNKQNEALNEARTRLSNVSETVGYGASTSSPDNTPEPSQEEMRSAIEQEEKMPDGSDVPASLEVSLEDDPSYLRKRAEYLRSKGRDDEADELLARADAMQGDDDFDDEDDDMSDLEGGEDKLSSFDRDMSDSQPFDDGDDYDDFEPATNICPHCEGAGEDCDECEGTGEVFEGKKPDFADIDKDGDKKESAKKASKDAKEEQEEVKECSCGCNPKTCKCKADCKCGCNAVKESVHSHATGNYPITHVDSTQPQNVDASYETIWDKKEEQVEDQRTKIKVPTKILSDLKGAITACTSESEKAKKANRDWERANYYEDTASALQIVHDLLSEKTVEGLKKAQYYSQRMMNIQRSLMPDNVWKFLVDGGVKRSLKSYMNDVKEPVTGKPFGIVNVDILNKNSFDDRPDRPIKK